MAKLIPALLACILLVACESKDESRTRIEQQLPHGCRLLDLGQYGSIDQIVAIVCDDKTVTTTGRIFRMCGKTACPVSFAIHTGVRPDV